MYTFSSKSKNTSIAIWNAEVYGKNYIKQSSDIAKLKETYSTVLERRDAIIGGKKIKNMVALIGKKQEDGSVDKNTLTLIFSLGDIAYMITTENYGSEKKAVNAALTLFVRNLKIKKELSSQDIGTFKNIAGTFKILPGMNIERGYGSTVFHFDSDLSQVGTISIEKTFDTE